MSHIDAAVEIANTLKALREAATILIKDAVDSGDLNKAVKVFEKVAEVFPTASYEYDILDKHYDCNLVERYKVIPAVWIVDHIIESNIPEEFYNVAFDDINKLPDEVKASIVEIITSGYSAFENDW